jgi:hypothetical protein
MSCARYEAELLDAAIGGPASVALDQHLASCAACRGRLDDERRLVSGADLVLREALRVEPSQGFETRLLQAVRSESAARNRSSWQAWVWAAGLAAGLGMLVVGGLRWRAPWSDTLPHPAAVVPAATGPRPGERAAGREPTVLVPGPTPSPPRGALGPNGTGAPPRAAPGPRPAPREPEVLVPGGEEKALEQFVSLLRDPTVVAPRSLTDATDPETPLRDPEPLEILDLQPRPFDIAPLDGRSQS